MPGMGQKTRLSPCVGAKRGLGLVSGHYTLLSDAGQVTLLPCWPACAAGTYASADLMGL